METIFDHDPTDEEFDPLLGSGDKRDSKEEYIEFLDQDSSCRDIFRLLWSRGEYDLADSYLSKIHDHEYRRDVGLIGYLDPSYHNGRWQVNFFRECESPAASQSLPGCSLRQMLASSATVTVQIVGTLWPQVNNQSNLEQSIRCKRRRWEDGAHQLTVRRSRPASAPTGTEARPNGGT